MKIARPYGQPGVKCFKQTKDDWHSNEKIFCKRDEPTRLVEVSLYTLRDGQFRVCVWGNDDTGMERDFVSQLKAETAFIKVISEEFVNMSFLRDIGFLWA